MCEWTFTLTLRPGDYTVSTVCSTLLNPRQKSYSSDNILICDYIPSALHFKLVSGIQNIYLYGAVHWKNEIMVKEMVSVLPLKKSSNAFSI